MPPQISHNTSNPDALAQKIKDLISIGKLGEAIKNLIQFMRDFYKEMENDVITISFRFNELERNEIGGAWDRREISLDRVKLAQNVLQAVDMAQDLRK